jgi:hypothetical protein
MELTYVKVFCHSKIPEGIPRLGICEMESVEHPGEESRGKLKYLSWESEAQV